MIEFQCHSGIKKLGLKAVMAPFFLFFFKKPVEFIRCITDDNAQNYNCSSNIAMNQGLT